ncbi:MAG: hypothetical protein ACJ8OJ_20270, partial [Povalibacter sp.]
MNPGATLGQAQSFLSHGQTYASGTLLWLVLAGDLALAAIALVGPWLFFKVAQQRPDLGLRSLSKALLTFGVSSA